jgi:pimeloyl-ACP methyl ester carboxylesterase
MNLKWPRVAVILVLLPAIAGAEGYPELTHLAIRGQQQNLYFLPAGKDASGSKGTVLFSPGDGGWHGFAVSMAQHIAAAGYDTYCLDTHVYLSSFTTKNSTLRPSEVMRDYGELIRHIQGRSHAPVLLVGWSEGAGLDVLAAAAADNRALIAGVVAIGLPERSILGWRAADTITWITKKLPNEPTFASSDYLAKLEAPFFMIQSRDDEFTSLADAEQMFTLVKSPKRYVVINARNHSFDGARDQFFAQLSDGLQWIQANR